MYRKKALSVIFATMGWLALVYWANCYGWFYYVDRLAYIIEFDFYIFLLAWAYGEFVRPFYHTIEQKTVNVLAKLSLIGMFLMAAYQTSDAIWVTHVYLSRLPVGEAQLKAADDYIYNYSYDLYSCGYIIVIAIVWNLFFAFMLVTCTAALQRRNRK